MKLKLPDDVIVLDMEGKPVEDGDNPGCKSLPLRVMIARVLGTARHDDPIRVIDIGIKILNCGKEPVELSESDVTLAKEVIRSHQVFTNVVKAQCMRAFDRMQ